MENTQILQLRTSDPEIYDYEAIHNGNGYVNIAKGNYFDYINHQAIKIDIVSSLQKRQNIGLGGLVRDVIYEIIDKNNLILKNDNGFVDSIQGHGIIMCSMKSLIFLDLVIL